MTLPPYDGSRTRRRKGNIDISDKACYPQQGTNWNDSYPKPSSIIEEGLEVGEYVRWHDIEMSYTRKSAHDYKNYVDAVRLEIDYEDSLSPDHKAQIDAVKRKWLDYIDRVRMSYLGFWLRRLNQRVLMSKDAPLLRDTDDMTADQMKKAWVGLKADMEDWLDDHYTQSDSEKDIGSGQEAP